MNPLNSLIVSALQLFPKGFVKRFAMRYIAGEDISDAIRLVRKINSENKSATVDVLGENVSTKEEASDSAKAGLEVLEEINRNGLNANLSIKLTQFGLKIDTNFCFNNVKKVLDFARTIGIFVRIDMEDSTTVDATLKIYERLRKAGYENTGVVIQSYMRRSEADVKRLIEMKSSVRVVKGIYVEPESIAFKRKDEIRKNFVNLVGMLMDGKCHVAIATHDEKVIDSSTNLIKKLSPSAGAYEFQMLLGVRADLGTKLVKEGHKLRVYVPFGKQWHPYVIRRFKENPQVAGYVAKSILTGR